MIPRNCLRSFSLILLLNIIISLVGSVNWKDSYSLKLIFILTSLSDFDSLKSNRTRPWGRKIICQQPLLLFLSWWVANGQHSSIRCIKHKIIFAGLKPIFFWFHEEYNTSNFFKKQFILCARSYSVEIYSW